MGRAVRVQQNLANQPINCYRSKSKGKVLNQWEKKIEEILPIAELMSAVYG
jgi:hypothetical protein